ncbi:MAG TPA: hypothetical protein VGU72_04425 [Beijerinckiaceae bacterium]|jgi:hypothetical protein|nr:hypothetical protein [Beijerinckiaceae bacterium]
MKMFRFSRAVVAAFWLIVAGFYGSLVLALGGAVLRELVANGLTGLAFYGLALFVAVATFCFWALSEWLSAYDRLTS